MVGSVLVRDPPPLTRVSPSAIRSYMVSDMDENTTALERAFQLATSGRCASVKDIRVTLAAEGYPREQLTGPLSQNSSRN